jgi:DNA polymerase elongation subunit (family B)
MATAKKYRSKDIYKIGNQEEAAMVYGGYSYFLGLQISQIPILSFDIEAAGLTKDDESDVYLITNTFRKGDEIVRKHFRVDHYSNCGEMIEDWCCWVQSVDPKVIVGHNIYGYDLPYLKHCANMHGRELILGLDSEEMKISNFTSKKRVDGNTTWEYKNITIRGREIIDTMFTSVSYDVQRNYPTWGLKPIIEYHGLVAEDRQFYDASKIYENWKDPIEREKIIQYGIQDSDDALALFDIQCPSLFYMNQSVPKTFQQMGTSASGSQLNSIMVRSYLQLGETVAKASEDEYVAGGMSWGIPGVYDNVVKWDAASYYPSTILKFKIYDEVKDPKANFLTMIDFFTKERFKNKRLYKETGIKYYDDMQGAQKIVINSGYGVLATKNLNYNSYKNAQLITKCCRAGLQKTILWATGKDVDYWWGVDNYLYKQIKYDSIEDLETKYQDSFEIIDNETAWVPKEKSGDHWKVCYKHSRTSTQDFEDFTFIDNKAQWSTDKMSRHNWKLVNLDTDSLSFCKKDEAPFTKEEYDQIFDEINKIMYSAWEDDGEFKKVVVLRAKNYILKDKNNKITLKGSSLKSSNKEPILKELLEKIIDVLIDEKNY